MNKKYIYLALALSLPLLSSANSKRKAAVNPVVVQEEIDTVPALLKNYKDSLTLVKAQLDSLRHINDSISAISGCNNDAVYYPLFSPLAYYPQVISGQVDLVRRKSGGEVEEEVSGMLLYEYLNHPEYVLTTKSKLDRAASLATDAPTRPISRKLEVQKQVAPVKEEEIKDSEPLAIKVVKPNFWSFSGDYSLQFMQNSVSDNWYKGGEDNLSAIGVVLLKLNYNNKQKLKIENTLEMRLGMQTSESDTMHVMKPTTDILRYTGKVGIQAHKKWYYTLQLLATTQFMKGYKTNSAEVYSDFMSPLEVNTSVGMDYTVDAFKKKLTGSVHLAPVAHNLKHVSRNALISLYGISEGHNNNDSWGSQMTVNLNWKPNSVFKWATRFYAYTTYKSVTMEWENTLTLSFNKYISANLFIYPRFDDNVKRKDDASYLQLKEYLSLGFSYSM